MGVTSNLERRMAEHQFKNVSSFTSRYNLNRLIYYEEFQRIEDSIAAEKKIKGWTRNKKLDLVKTINPDFNNLFKGN